jgi:high-affinity iron transporter
MMLSTIIVVLREILEACLITGVVAAALKDLNSRYKIMLISISSGILFSLIIALSLRKLTSLFDGNGQEILNIIILSTSIICIAWTVLWINNSGKELYHKISNTSTELQTKQLSMWPLILIIALAISREGAELTLFMNGIYFSGAHIDDLIYGFIFGSMIGIFLGFLLYKGLLKISPKYFFQAINIMLIFLAAGMAARLANYFNSSDIISVFSETIWDSSWLVNDTSLGGKILHNLIGYSSRPTKLQIIFYSLTIIILFGLSKFKKFFKPYT